MIEKRFIQNIYNLMHQTFIATLSPFTSIIFKNPYAAMPRETPDCSRSRHYILINPFIVFDNDKYLEIAMINLQISIKDQVSKLTRPFLVTIEILFGARSQNNIALVSKTRVEDFFNFPFASSSHPGCTAIAERKKIIIVVRISWPTEVVFQLRGMIKELKPFKGTLIRMAKGDILY